MKYLLDTNTVIYYINNSLPADANRLIASLVPAISFITRIELLAWSELQLPEKLEFEEFIENAIVHTCEEAIILQTINIRKQHKLKLPDAIIAATAKVYDLTLLSRNLKDFKSIPDLRTIDPYSL